MNAKQVFEVLTILAKVAPIVVELVRELDAIDSGPGSGKEKFLIVVATVRAALEQGGLAEGGKVDWEKLLPYLGDLVDRALRIVRGGKG